MPTDIVMPQLGESIAEGTIVRWLKKVGDTIQRDEPLLEISTDKVDAEIPSTAAGTILEIKANEGDTVLVNAVIAVIGEAGEASAPTAAAAAPPVVAPPAPTPVAPPPPVAPPAAASGSATSVVMPQLGESIAEGTIVRWLKKVGAEYANMFISSTIIAVLYFGGYNYPGMQWMVDNVGVNTANVLGIGVLFIKICAFIFFYMWVRWTIPRFRYDQLMNLGWKILIPLSILNIIITGICILAFK